MAQNIFHFLRNMYIEQMSDHTKRELYTGTLLIWIQNCIGITWIQIKHIRMDSNKMNYKKYQGEKVLTTYLGAMDKKF